MSDISFSDLDAVPVEETGDEEGSSSSSAFVRVGRYTLVRMIALFATVVIGVYLTVLIANMGGYVDEIRRGAIREQVSISVGLNPQYDDLTTEAKNALIADRIALEEKRLGLDRPFMVRSFIYLKDAMTLDLGRAEQITSDSGSKEVRLILLERLPPTLLMWGLSNLLLFFVSLFFALVLSRRYGSLVDKAIVALTPTSSAPAWFYGIFLILIFAAGFGILPYGTMVDAPPPENPLLYALSVMKHLILPTGAIVISTVFLNIYSWRTFFLIYSSEDYVELAKAKGLSDRAIERRYVLRPTLPTIITNFALLLITLWSGAIILETIFNWPGLGRVYFTAIGLFDTPVILATTVIYAYLLAITVFLLDFVYALVDPRVTVGGGSKAA